MKWSAVAALLLAAPLAIAEGERPSFALRAARILPQAVDLPAAIEHGVIVVRDGRIAAIGADVAVPADLAVIDLGDVVVMPGLVAANSDLAGSHNGPESIGGGYRALDAFDPFADYAPLLAQGITTVHLDPGWHRLVSGQGAVVKLGGARAERVLLASADMTVNFVDEALSPPAKINVLKTPSADHNIEPPRPQLPSERAGRSLALADALAAPAPGDEYSFHVAAFAAAVKAGMPLRVHAQRAPDLLAGAAFLAAHGGRGYLVGGIEIAAAKDLDPRWPLVYTLDPGFGFGADLGDDPDADWPDLSSLAKVGARPLALATARNVGLEDLRLAAAMALASGLARERVLAAITRVPAELLGVADKVGTLAVGRDADLAVFAGDPLSTSATVLRTYVNGRLVWKSAEKGALLVEGGTLWLGPGETVENGAVLMRDGRIRAAGAGVGAGAGASVRRVPAGAWIVPGFIDGFSHLGLEGDRTAIEPEISLGDLVGAASAAERRVARSGVTTAIVGPYTLGGGSQLMAVKTAGDDRASRLLRQVAAVGFDVRGSDAKGAADVVRGRLNAAKQYAEQWKKWEADVAEFDKKKAENKPVEVKPQPEAKPAEPPAADPLSGTWNCVVSGARMPAPLEGPVAIVLTGKTFEGRLLDPQASQLEHSLTGTLDGNQITGHLELRNSPFGSLELSGTLDGESFHGTLKRRNREMTVEATRTDKARPELKVEFKAAPGKKKGDGRPEPPKVDEGLDALRAALDKKIPLLVQVDSKKPIGALLDLLTQEFDVPLVLGSAFEAKDHAARLRDKNVGVLLPRAYLRTEPGPKGDVLYNQASDLAEQGVRVAFQSEAEDSARNLRTVLMKAVASGMSRDAALAAATIDAARMFKLDDRVGRLAGGTDGDLLVFSAHPLDPGARLLLVVVNGEVVYDAEADS